MAWAGWYEFGGVEIVNAARAEAYAKAAGVGWFRPVYFADDLGPVLGEVYNSPMQDDAPWTDVDFLDSYDFLGAYPLSITGVEDSTATAAVVESTLDGGVVGRPRRSTRTMVFQLALMGTSECAVEYGLRWLKMALSGGPCTGSADYTCQGQTLCYLSCEPCIDWLNCVGADPGECLFKYQRSMHKVAAISGPTVQSKHTMSDGGVTWVVGFTLVAGSPYEYGKQVRLVEGFMRRDNPYVLGVVDETGEVPAFDDQGSVFDEVSCKVATYQPLEDPECPQSSLPPGAPTVALSCFKLPSNYRRRQFLIPEQYVPLWGELVPYMEIHAPAKQDVRKMRLRFYADVLGEGDPNNDPCAFCGDIVFSYIPAGSTLVFDGTDEIVYIEEPGGRRRRADSVVFGSDGTPFEWPQLSCGYSYIVTVDLLQSQTSLPGIDFSMCYRGI
jgi:hypothetical protein